MVFLGSLSQLSIGGVGNKQEFQIQLEAFNLRHPFILTMTKSGQLSEKDRAHIQSWTMKRRIDEVLVYS